MALTLTITGVLLQAASHKMQMKTIIETKLTAAFSPSMLDVIDDSESHRGHGGWREGGETHFNVRIVAAAFDGMNRVNRQRAVHKALKEELAQSVHALQLTVKGEQDET